MRRWYATVKMQLAIDADGNMTAEDIEGELASCQLDLPYVPRGRLEMYVPDQVDVEYLEPADA